MPILATKLYIPPPRPTVVVRTRLIERLNEGLHRKLTLVSAPAGFGKTTLVSEWVKEIERPIAWLSLDEEDNDSTRFLIYFIAALQTIVPTIGEGVLAVLQSPQPALTESILTALLNEINTIADTFVLVLEDYHVIDAKPVENALTFLLEHLPPQMHLVITTRDDPQLPVARLRARGQLTELRAADLRFTQGEASAFLNQVMGLDLSVAHIATLEDRTEGWIAGLQLAALSIRGRDDIAQFVRTFTGDNRFIVDYLVEEVLQRQPEAVRSFLLQTAILDRLNGSLCDAVTEQQDGSARLESLERGNFFVVPLDDKRHWYRYHHLFADVLYAHLMAEQPDQVFTLHRRASQWYETHGSVVDAIRYALAAEDFERTADLIELAVPAMRRSRQDATLIDWLKALPDELVRARPVLSVHLAGMLLSSGEIEDVEVRLQDAERRLDKRQRERPETSSAEIVVVDEEEFRRLPGQIAIYRAGRALILGDVPATVTHALRALDLVPEDDHFRRGAAMALLGLAYWTKGDLEAAHQSYDEGMARLQRAGNITDAIHGTTVSADIRIAQGHLHQPMRTYEQALQLATEQSVPVLWGTADLYVGMSEIDRERNDLHAATEHLLRSKELCERTGLAQNWSRWCVAMARIREAEGDLGGAIDLLHEAERRMMRDFYPTVRPVAAVRIRTWLAQGRLDEARQWVQETGFSVDDELSYLREFEHITLVRVFIADHRIPEAVRLLDRLLQAAQAGGRMGSVIEIEMLQSLAHQSQNKLDAALVALEHALKLAEPEGYIRIFVDEGVPMAQLLSEATARGMMPDYTGKLLSFIEAEHQRSEGSSSHRTLTASQPLIEPLTERELEILQLIALGFSNREISERLFLALDTIKGHNGRIFAKLAVQRRTEAVAHARELGLL